MPVDDLVVELAIVFSVRDGSEDGHVALDFSLKSTDVFFFLQKGIV